MGLIHFTEDTQPARVEDSLIWKEPRSKPVQEQKAPKQKEARKDDGITSLSYDQVNDNADELIELRGEGRYFGVTDPDTGDAVTTSSGPVCDNCHQRGHTRAKCKLVICHKCGVENDHYETQCPTTMVCARCGERGHVTATCKSKTRKRQYCGSCDSFSHGNENCPSIWRSYLTIPIANNSRLPVAYCYNCGEDTHYGDECSQQRTSRIPNMGGSAFSGNNLPKELRNAYFETYYGRGKRGYESSYSTGNSEPPKKKAKSKSHSKAPSQAKQSKPQSQGSHNPSRSGYIAAKSGPKKPALPAKPLPASRSGYLPNKKNVKPNRSGVVPRGKKPGNRNFQALY